MKTSKKFPYFDKNIITLATAAIFSPKDVLNNSVSRVLRD